jgi:SecD/SecF fusion protein
LETVVVKHPNETDRSDIMINFDKNGTLVWKSLSKSNIGKPIAIVLDNVVYCAPRVMGEINNGKCIISGDFSIKEITLLKSLISNDELPLEFKLKK